jgi:DNA-binding CsgD family transcriptional regulator/PAS domain-containing protein
MELEELSRTISQIYDCALDPSLWPATLDHLNQFFGSSFAAVFLAQNEPFTPLAYFHSTWDEIELQRLVYEFAPHIPGVLDTMTGAIGIPVSLLARLDQNGVSEHLQSRFYREWVKPQGLGDAVITKFCQTRNRSGTFQLIGARDWELEMSEIARLVELLLPHLRRAVLISDLLEQNCLKLESLQSTINLMASPIILTRSDRVVCYANTAAARFLESGEALRELNGRLTIADINTRRAFEEALLAASRGDQGIGAQGIGIPLFSDQGYPAVCYMLPINQSKARSANGEASIALFVSTLAHAAPAPAAIVATIFGLTSAEARVACELQSREALGAAADRLGISANTVKTHLKRIYEKTGTSRRSELHELIYGLSPATVGQTDGGRHMQA